MLFCRKPTITPFVPKTYLRHNFYIVIVAVMEPNRKRACVGVMFT